MRLEGGLGILKDQGVQSGGFHPLTTNPSHVGISLELLRHRILLRAPWCWASRMAQQTEVRAVKPNGQASFGTRKVEELPACCPPGSTRVAHMLIILAPEIIILMIKSSLVQRQILT